MIHKMTVRSNPRLILFGLLVVGVPLLGVALFWFLRGIIGIVAVLGAGFFTYQLITFILPSLRVRIETSSDGIRCTRPGNDDIAFAWSEVTHAGWFTKNPTNLPSFCTAKDMIVLSRSRTNSQISICCLLRSRNRRLFRKSGSKKPIPFRHGSDANYISRLMMPNVNANNNDSDTTETQSA
jgi:hypothetical protein